MVESFEQSARNIKKHVPKIAKIKEIVVPAQFAEKFGYPENEPVADYLVRYESAKDFGGTYLIEAADSNLRRELKQLESSAEIFRRLGVQINNYLLVIKRLSKHDNKKYKLKSCLPKPFKYIHEKVGETKVSSPVKINGKKVRFIYEEQIKKV